MSLKSNCNTCDICDLLVDLNQGLINIADARLYNIRYELDRPVDYEKYRLIKFYKRVAQDICNNADCGCYTTSSLPLNRRVHETRCEHPWRLGCEGCDSTRHDTVVANTIQNISEQIRTLVA